MSFMMSLADAARLLTRSLITIPKQAERVPGGADKLIAFILDKRLTTEWILETHAHADHISSAAYLKRKLGGKTAIGKEIPTVQKTFKKIFNLGPEFVPDGKHFDHLFADGEVLTIGKLTGKVIFTPGHTPADLSYQCEDAVFVGDTLFMPDLGTARADFPGGDAQRLFRSIRKLLDFPTGNTLVHVPRLSASQSAASLGDNGGRTTR